MTLPDYWLPRPPAARDDDVAAFDALLEAHGKPGGCPTIAYDLPFPKWQFLCHLADRHPLVLHGSGSPDIERFEPRPSDDLSPFGNQTAVYAAADGLWAMFFAIVDRDRFAMSVANACIRLVDAKRQTHGPYYVFSVSKEARARRPWRTGTVYLLPRESFVPQPPQPFGAMEVHIAQWASLDPVVPLAKLVVTPEDFPFLTNIREHEDHRLQEYATAMQTGAPWP